MARKPSPAQVRKSSAVAAYEKQFGRPPRAKMTTTELERAVRPLRTPSMMAVERMPRQAVAAARPKTPDGRPVPKARATGTMSNPAIGATSKLPYEQWQKYSAAKWARNNQISGDRNAAAQILRDFRTSQGRALPTGTMRTAVTKFAMRHGVTVAAATPYAGLALAGAMGYKAAGDIGQGFMYDGFRGAIRETADFATFGMGGGKAVDAVLGKPSIGDVVARIMPFETQGQTAARKTREALKARPTRKMREGIDKAHGIDTPKPGMTSQEKRLLGNYVVGGVVGGLGAGVAIGAQAAVVKKTAEVAAMGLAKVAPNLAAKIMPRASLLGLAVAGAGMAAIALSSRRASAAPAPPQAERTKAYTDKNGRRFDNGRLITTRKAG